MRRLIAGLMVGLVMGGGIPALAGIDSHHPRHERIEDAVCERPGHFYKAHGIKIIPEACDG